MVDQAVKNGPLCGLWPRADFGGDQGPQHGRGLTEEGWQHRQWDLYYAPVPHAVEGQAAARRQDDPTPLLQFEHQRPGGHVFELADSVMPIPQLRYFLTDSPAAPVRMVCDQLANLIQLRRPDSPALNNFAILCLTHSARVWQTAALESRTISNYFLAGSLVLLNPSEKGEMRTSLWGARPNSSVMRRVPGNHYEQHD